MFRKAKRKTKAEHATRRNRSILLPTAGSIQRQNVSHTAGRVPTDPTTLSCSWENRSGRGETVCAEDDTHLCIMLSTSIEMWQ